MNIKLDISVLNDRASFQHVDQLIALLETGQHTLLFDANDIDNVIESDWFNSIGERHQDAAYELLKKSAVNATYKTAAELREREIIHIQLGQQGLHSLENIIKLCEEPVQIVIEDIESDQLFIRRLLEVYKNAGKQVTKALEKGWCRFSHSGGKTRTPAVIINHFNDRPQPFKPRLIAIIDSDKTHGNSNFSVETNRVLDLCNERGLKLHVYEKREIENYMPDAVLRKLIPNELQETVDAFCNMTPEQKDFFDLEIGFDNRRPSQADPLFSEFYRSENYTHLKKGFMHDNFNPKREIFNFVIDVDFNQTNIQQRCQHQNDPDELRSLIKKIHNLL